MVLEWGECGLASLLYAGLDPNWLRARPVVLKLEQEPEVGISMSSHARDSATKVNILYQGLNYHVKRDPGLGLGIRPMVDHLF